MRILVGGAGYLGQRIANLLAEEGYDVIAVCRSLGSPRGESRQVTWQIADLSQPGLNWWPEHVGALVVCVPPRAPGYQLMLKALSEKAAAGARQVVLASSTGVYAEENGGWVDEESPLDTSSPRGQNLVEAEHIVKAAQCAAISILRFSGIYGPGRSPWHRYARPSIPTTTPTATGVESSSWTNRVHVEDAAEAVRLTITSALHGIFNVSDEYPARAEDIAAWMERRRGTIGTDRIPPKDPDRSSANSPLPFDSPAVSLDNATMVPRRGSNKRVSSAKLRRLGWNLRYPDFRSGWLAEQASLNSVPQ